MMESLRSVFFKIDRSTQKLTTGRIPYFDSRYSLFDIRYSLFQSFFSDQAARSRLEAALTNKKRIFLTKDEYEANAWLTIKAYHSAALKLISFLMTN
jgi:hypothetical protein